MKLRFDKKYGLIFIVILVIEILIALYITNPMVRGTFGDILVIILIYCFIQTFLELDKAKTIIGIGLFAVLIEISQAFHLVEKLNLQNNKFVSTVIGNTFDMNDIWAYVAGCALIYMLEFSNENKRPRKRKLF